MNSITNKASERLTWFIRLAAEAITSVFSQTLGTEWKLESEPRPAEGDLELELVFTSSGALSGEFSLCLRKSDAVLLAGRFMGDASADGSAEFTAEHRECVDELFRQVAGQLTVALRAELGEVRLELNSLKTQLDSPDAHLQLPLVSGDVRLSVALRLNQDLVAAINQRVVQETAAPSPAASSMSPPQAKPLGSQPSVREQNLGLLLEIELPATLRFGQTVMRLKDILQLSAGAVIDLDRQIQEPVELLVDGHLMARGEVVIVDGNYGLRVTEVATPGQRVAAIP